MSAQLAVSHSGAIAGDDAAYDALFDRYGVQRVDDMEQLAVALILFSAMHPVGDGGLVALHDSGGERQLMIDLADAHQVPLTTLNDETVAKLEATIDPELPAVNPLDGWSRGGPGADQQMTDALTYMMQDPGAALGALVLDRAPNGRIYDEYVDRMSEARRLSGKPVALVSAWQGSGSDPLAISMTHAGMPVLDGVSPYLVGVRALMNYRDFRANAFGQPDLVDDATVDVWKENLHVRVLHEVEAMALLRDFGIAASPARLVDSESGLLAAALEFGWPVALKTAANIAHKTDKDGVRLGIDDERSLLREFADLQDRLGPDVLIAPMAPPGIELILGARRDPQFGPVVVLGIGGIHSEILRDVVFALPPFDEGYALAMLERLQFGALLDGARGAKPVDRSLVAAMASRFSAMVYSLRDEISEIDINPVIASANSCIAVDALIVGTEIGSRK